MLSPSCLPRGNLNTENSGTEFFILGSNKISHISFWYLTPSVSSFVRKTTEKIGTLHTSPDLKVRPEPKGDEQSCEEDVNPVTCPKEEDTEGKQEVASQPSEEDKFQELKIATIEAV